MNTEETKLDEQGNNINPMLSAVKFIEWVVELLPPEYDMDARHRFTPHGYWA